MIPVALMMVALNVEMIDKTIGSFDYPNLPPLFICDLACKQAEADWRWYNTNEEFVLWGANWKIEEFREQKAYAYLLWDAWWYAAALRKSGSYTPIEVYEDRLKWLMGPTILDHGQIPLPISWTQGGGK